jgi:hypothetical protein
VKGFEAAIPVVARRNIELLDAMRGIGLIAVATWRQQKKKHPLYASAFF